MIPKSENNQFKKEIKFNEAMDKKLKQLSFDATFKKGTTDNSHFLELIPIEPERRASYWYLFKNWILFVFAVIACIVLLVLIFTEKPSLSDNEHHWNVVESAQHQIIAPKNHSENVMALGLVEETTTATEPSTTSSTTAAETSTKAVIDYILASIIVNNATVPQMDKTLFSNKADVYVELYIIDGTNHRKVGTTPADKNTLYPKWNYLFEHEMKLSVDSMINFELYDSDRFNKDELIGKLYVKMENLMADGLNGQIVKRNYGRGSIWFTVHWREVYKRV